MAREMGSPRHVDNRRRRTREGPEPACVRLPCLLGGTLRGEGRIGVLPWYSPVGVAIPPVSRKGGRTGLPVRVRGRQSSPILAQASRGSVAVRAAPR